MVDLFAEEFGKIIIVHIKGFFNINNLNEVEDFWFDQMNRDPEVIAINCNKLCDC